jgi:hypothetical protein
MTDEPTIADLATAWLAAERVAQDKGNEVRSETEARAAAAAFEDAVRAASQEDLLLAWESARKRQQAQEVGSSDWAHARSVSELLRAEYAASRD